MWSLDAFEDLYWLIMINFLYSDPGDMDSLYSRKHNPLLNKMVHGAFITHSSSHSGLFC